MFDNNTARWAKWFHRKVVEVEVPVYLTVLTPIILDENNVEYEIIEKTALQWLVRPKTILVEEGDGPLVSRHKYTVYPVGVRFIDGFKAGLEHQCRS